MRYTIPTVRRAADVIIEIKPEMSLAEMIINPKTKEPSIHPNLQELLDSKIKLRRAVAFVISEASPQRQKEVKEAIKNSAIEETDFLIGLPCAYALNVAKRIYEEKKIEYREKHNIPLEDYSVKPYPVTFNYTLCTL